MRLVTLSYIGDEEDIIEPFIRHHAVFADRMVIVCTARESGTPAILQKLQGEGLPLEISYHVPVFHDQADILTGILSDVHDRLQPQWILPLDADEFLCGQYLSTALNLLSRDSVTLVPWRTYVPHPTDDVRETNPLRRICHRREREEPQFYKVLIPSTLLQEDSTLSAGNHALLQGGIPCPTIHTESLFLAHFPVRSIPQIRRKATEGWRKIQANPKRGEEEGYHWGLLADYFSDGEAKSSEDLMEIARSYSSPSASPLVLDPCPALMGNIAETVKRP